MRTYLLTLITPNDMMLTSTDAITSIPLQIQVASEKIHLVARSAVTVMGRLTVDTRRSALLRQSNRALDADFRVLSLNIISHRDMLPMIDTMPIMDRIEAGIILPTPS